MVKDLWITDLTSEICFGQELIAIVGGLTLFTMKHQELLKLDKQRRKGCVLIQRNFFILKPNNSVYSNRSSSRLFVKAINEAVYAYFSHRINHQVWKVYYKLIWVDINLEVHSPDPLVRLGGGLNQTQDQNRRKHYVSDTCLISILSHLIRKVSFEYPMGSRELTLGPEF
ncbi:hypothetical protein Ccrd_002353 [Cynara cardunculus var. scolymus]|uniref:Uncharacterized protein n=1 Tax=Cynara cardunculus var. scolymus TaxID=59895 RepID=A0A103XRL0_CYNCS|nr:hypothetical protein Ccrd_002353 [Cynara cardunculus var. scolymus]